MNRRVAAAMVVLMCCALGVRAQWTVDSLKHETWQQLSEKYHQPLFTLDQDILGRALPQARLEALKPKDIANIDIIRSTSNPAVYGREDYIVVYVISKSFAKKEYQKKLSAFSPDYKNYLESRGNDDGLQYILNSQPIKNNSDELLDLLYKLAPERITSVALTGIKGKQTLIIDINFDE